MPIPFLRPRRGRSYETHTTSSVVRSFLSRIPWLTVAKIAAVGAGLAFIGGTLMVVVMSRELPDPGKLADRQVAQSTKIYDSTGEHLLYEVFQNQKRTAVRMDEMSPWLPKAVVAVEDKHFYEHNGVRVPSIIRAGVNNLIGRRVGGGGASTLTQQLIKNTIIGDEYSLFRKIKEAILAIQLERKYTKDEILTMYLNEVPFGSTNYGVESAAQSYFRKSAKDLSLAESATLAAIIQAPSRYLNNLTRLQERRDGVLRMMTEQGYISEAERKEAEATPLRLYRNTGIFSAPHFVLHVKQLLADQFGEKTVDTAGLKVITSLDYDKQQVAEKIVKEQGEKFEKTANANNAALVAMEPKTGKILAMVGSRDFYNEEINGQWNVVTQSLLQPGSSFKPFVYLFGFEKGFTPDTVIYDVKTEFDTTGQNSYSPRNSSDKQNGLITVRKALQGSLNIPAVKMLYMVGIKDVIEFAKRFGYTSFTGEYGLSMVLGAAEVNMLEHTNAYATLANNGRYVPAVSILKVTDAKGNVLYEWQPTDGVEAVKPELAATLTSVLTDDEARAYVFGRRGNLTLSDRPVAAKTGTTQDSKDAWTMGYTPSIATGVWVGNTPKPAAMKAGGNALAGTIWNMFMREATKGMPVEQFPEPPPNDATKPVLRGADGGIKLKINSTNGRIATSSTPENLIVERTFLPPHDILHYVRRDDPRGEPPTNPADDPQYENWERGLQEWVGRMQAAGQGVVLEEPPTLYDNEQDAELAPTIDITSPAAGSVVTTRDLTFTVEASAPRGVARVMYVLDGFTVGTATQYPFSFSYNAQRLTNGPHILKAIAQDDIGNSATREAQFVLQAEQLPPSFEWQGSSPMTLVPDDFPRAMYLSPYRWEDMQDIKVYLSSGGGGERLIYTFNHQEDKLFNNQLVFTWKNNPGTGTHMLRAVMTDKTGATQSQELQIDVR